MSHLPWAIVALAAYSLVAPLMRLATTGDVPIPSAVATFYSNAVLVAVTVAVVAGTGGRLAPYATHPKIPYVYAAGLCLGIGILAYYYALSRGPVSVVTPIFGMFVATSSIIGVVVLNESLTLRRGAGIVLGVVAVYLVAGSGG
jgi:transporter family protein